VQQRGSQLPPPLHDGLHIAVGSLAFLFLRHMFLLSYGKRGFLQMHIRIIDGDSFFSPSHNLSRH
jgi:hypothetical protein